mgnify:CR=1 FL=1
MKYIIITGGSGGIGSQITSALLRANYHVIVVGRSQNNFDLMAVEVINNQNLSFYKVDVSDKNKVKSFYSDLNKINCDIFALVNAAGVQGPIGKFTKIDYNDWIINLSNNFLGTVNMIRGFLSITNKNHHRKIINFSGGGSTSSRTNFSAYAVSKTAIVKFTEILSDEIADQNIDINAIAPGAVYTPMVSWRLSEEMRAHRKNTTALGTEGTPWDVAWAAVYLASDESKWVTGSVLTVDGGSSILSRHAYTDSEIS